MPLIPKHLLPQLFKRSITIPVRNTLTKVNMASRAAKPDAFYYIPLAEPKAKKSLFNPLGQKSFFNSKTVPTLTQQFYGTAPQRRNMATVPTFQDVVWTSSGDPARTRSGHIIVNKPSPPLGYKLGQHGGYVRLTRQEQEQKLELTRQSQHLNSPHPKTPYTQGTNLETNPNIQNPVRTTFGQPSPPLGYKLGQHGGYVRLGLNEQKLTATYTPGFNLSRQFTTQTPSPRVDYSPTFSPNFKEAEIANMPPMWPVRRNSTLIAREQAKEAQKRYADTGFDPAPTFFPE